MSTPTQSLKRSVEQKLKTDGTWARIEARQARNEAKAREMGYPSAQAAFNDMGRSFLLIANQ